MAKPNFSFKKRQREEAKEKKRLEKLERRLERSKSEGTDAGDAQPGSDPAVADTAPPAPEG